MPDSNPMSRRDWFRLRPQRSKSDDSNCDNHFVGEKSRGLQPIDQPVNHGEMDLSELPPMREAILSYEDVRQLFSDIESLGSDILLMQKSPRSRHASASKATAAEQLRAAQETLLTGSIPRVQIRYRWKDSNWIDTLENREDSVRLIRIAHRVTGPTSREAK